MGTITEYGYDFGDTSDGQLNSPRLAMEINGDAGITPGCSHINTDEDSMVIFMKDPLPPAEEAILDTIVGAHGGADESILVDPQQQGMYLYEFGDLMLVTATTQEDKDFTISTVIYLDAVEVRVLNGFLGDYYHILVVDNADPDTILKIVAMNQYIDTDEPIKDHQFKGALKLEPGTRLRVRYTSHASATANPAVVLNFGVWGSQ